MSNDRVSRTAVSVPNSSGPSVAVRGAQERPNQQNPNAGLGALNTYLEGNQGLSRSVQSAFGQAEDMAKRAEIERTRQNNRDAVARAELAGKMGEELPSDLLKNPNAVRTFQSTTGSLAGDELYQHFHEEVASQHTPGDPVSLKDKADDWIKKSIGENHGASTYNLAAYDQFMSRVSPDINEAQTRQEDAVVQTQRAGLGQAIRSRFKDGTGVNLDWYSQQVQSARTLFPGQSEGWTKAWVLNQAMGTALRGGEAGRKAYLGLINSMPSEDRPPEVDQQIKNFQTYINEGFSSEGDDAYQNLRDSISQAQSPEELNQAYARANDLYRRWGDTTQFRATAEAATKRSAALGKAAKLNSDFMGVVSGQDPYFDGTPKDWNENAVGWLRGQGMLPEIQQGANAQTIESQSHRYATVVTNLARSSKGLPSSVSNYSAGVLNNSANPAAQQAMVLSLSSMDQGTVDQVLQGHDQAKAIYSLMKDYAETGTGDFASRSELVTKNLPVYRDAATKPLKDITGDKNEIKATEGLWQAQGGEWLSHNDQDAPRLIAEAAGVGGYFSGSRVSVGPEVKTEFLKEFRNQYALSQIKGDGASVNTLRERAAQAVGQRVYSQDTRGQRGIIGGAINMAGQLVLGAAEASDFNQTLGGIVSTGRQETYKGWEHDLDRDTRPLTKMLRLRKNSFQGEVDGRPGYSSHNFTNSDTSSAALMQDDLNSLAHGQRADYQVVEGDYANQNYMTVQDSQTQLPATFAPGRDNSVSGPNGDVSFRIKDTPEATQAEFDQAAKKAGLPSSVTILPTKHTGLGGSSYTLVIGTRYPDNFAGAKPMRDARLQAAQSAATNSSLRQARQNLQTQGRLPPSEGTTVYSREPEDHDPVDYMQHLGNQDLIHGQPGQGDDLSSNDSTYQQRRFNFIGKAEGNRLTAYADTSGHPTIGYGFNMDSPGNKDIAKAALHISDAEWDDLKSGRKSLTSGEAVTLFNARIKQDDNAVALKTKGIPLSDQQRIGLTSMVYNAGPAELDDQLVTALRDGDMPAVARKVLFDTGHKHNAGLAARRWSEAMSIVGKRALDDLVSSGLLPSYSDYQDAQASKTDWHDFRSHYMS